MLIGVEKCCFAFLTRWYGNACNFCFEFSGIVRFLPLALRFIGKQLLGFSAYTIAFCHVFCRFAHAVWVIKRSKFLVGKPPANGCIMDFYVALKRHFPFRHHKRSPGHAFGATCNNQFCYATFNGHVTIHDALQSAGAQPVYRISRDFNRQACKQRSHPGHVTVVFSGLVGRTKDHFIGFCIINFRVAPHDFFDCMCRQVVWPYR